MRLIQIAKMSLLAAVTSAVAVVATGCCCPLAYLPYADGYALSEPMGSEPAAPTATRLAAMPF